jgi:AraC-like DNA-binding protein
VPVVSFICGKKLEKTEKSAYINADPIQRHQINEAEDTSAFSFELKTMNVGLIDIINFIALFQLSVFILFLWLKKPRRQSNVLLAIFLFSQIALLANAQIFRYARDIYAHCPRLFFIGTPFFFIAAPSFYLYVKSLAFSDFIINKRQLLHALPFLFLVIVFITMYHSRSAETQRTLLESTRFLQSFRWYYSFIVHIYILGYILSALRILGVYRKKIKQEYSSVEHINLSWLNFILYAFLFACCTSILATFSFPFTANTREKIQLVNFLAFFIFFNFIFFKALIQPDLFTGVKEIPRQKRPFLSKSLEKKYLNKLLAYMDDEKPYLMPEITLVDLSTKVSIPHRALSEVINNSLHQNFYDFINSYRIKESLHFLKNRNGKHKTILEVLYAVGYNSKSSFNVAFKKHTGMTPSYFKKHHHP